MFVTLDLCFYCLYDLLYILRLSLIIIKLVELNWVDKYKPELLQACFVILASILGYIGPKIIMDLFIQVHILSIHVQCLSFDSLLLKTEVVDVGYVDFSSYDGGGHSIPSLEL